MRLPSGRRCSLHWPINARRDGINVSDLIQRVPDSGLSPACPITPGVGEAQSCRTVPNGYPTPTRIPYSSRAVKR
jgi:hypothetical protein